MNHQMHEIDANLWYCPECGGLLRLEYVNGRARITWVWRGDVNAGHIGFKT